MLKEKYKLVILALADNGMKAKPAARELGLHWNVVYARMDRIYDLTGLDPRNFYDLHELVQMVNEEEDTNG